MPDFTTGTTTLGSTALPFTLYSRRSDPTTFLDTVSTANADASRLGVGGTASVIIPQGTQYELGYYQLTGTTPSGNFINTDGTYNTAAIQGRNCTLTLVDLQQGGAQASNRVGVRHQGQGGEPVAIGVFDFEDSQLIMSQPANAQGLSGFGNSRVVYRLVNCYVASSNTSSFTLQLRALLPAESDLGGATFGPGVPLLLPNGLPLYNINFSTSNNNFNNQNLDVNHRVTGIITGDNVNWLPIINCGLQGMANGSAGWQNNFTTNSCDFFFLNSTYNADSQIRLSGRSSLPNNITHRNYFGDIWYPRFIDETNTTKTSDLTIVFGNQYTVLPGVAGTTNTEVARVNYSTGQSAPTVSTAATVNAYSSRNTIYAILQNGSNAVVRNTNNIVDINNTYNNVTLRTWEHRMFNTTDGAIIPYTPDTSIGITPEGNSFEMDGFHTVAINREIPEALAFSFADAATRDNTTITNVSRVYLASKRVNYEGIILPWIISGRNISPLGNRNISITNTGSYAESTTSITIPSNTIVKDDSFDGIITTNDIDFNSASAPQIDYSGTVATRTDLLNVRRFSDIVTHSNRDTDFSFGPATILNNANIDIEITGDDDEYIVVPNNNVTNVTITKSGGGAGNLIVLVNGGSEASPINASTALGYTFGQDVLPEPQPAIQLNILLSQIPAGVAWRVYHNGTLIPGATGTGPGNNMILSSDSTATLTTAQTVLVFTGRDTFTNLQSVIPTATGDLVPAPLSSILGVPASRTTTIGLTVGVSLNSSGYIPLTISDSGLDSDNSVDFIGWNAEIADSRATQEYLNCIWLQVDNDSNLTIPDNGVLNHDAYISTPAGPDFRIDRVFFREVLTEIEVIPGGRLTNDDQDFNIDNPERSLQEQLDTRMYTVTGTAGEPQVIFYPRVADRIATVNNEQTLVNTINTRGRRTALGIP